MANRRGRNLDEKRGITEPASRPGRRTGSRVQGTALSGSCLEHMPQILMASTPARGGEIPAGPTAQHVADWCGREDTAHGSATYCNYMTIPTPLSAFCIYVL